MIKELLRRVKIGYATFKIQHVSRKALGQTDFGELEYGTNVIRIFGQQSNEELVNTLMHEIGHGICYIFNIQFKTPREEEDFIREYTNGIITVFRDNPKLLTFLKRNLKNLPND